MKLEDLGYNSITEELRSIRNLNSFDIGRVIAEHKERYLIGTSVGEVEAEITGNIRFAAKSREDFPAVGDWVAITYYGEGYAVINEILPRFSIIKRQAVAHFGEVQIIATNIDYAFLIQSVDRDFNVNRLERYLTICYSSKVNPIIVLTKTDLINEQQLNEMSEELKQRVKDVPVFAISNKNRDGYKKLSETIQKGKTYCMLGSSGVGKSTLLNNLSGKSIMKTDEISQHTNKGRHISSHRILTILENGGILIDNPGMREVGIPDSISGLETTFDKIINLSKNCKFKNCSHKNETGCAIIEALKRGEIEQNFYDNYLKLEREEAHFSSTTAEKHKKNKEFGKMIKNYKKDMKRNQY